MQRTFFAGSPWVKSVCFASNWLTFLPRPADSRNNLTSNTGPLELAFLGERRALPDTRRTAVDIIHHGSINPRRVQYWTVAQAGGADRDWRQTLISIED